MKRRCERVEEDPEGFWSEVAGRLDWIKPFTMAKDVSFDATDFHIRWFADGVLNASRQLPRPAPARIAPTTSPSSGRATIPRESRKISYAEAHAETCRMANVLKAHGVEKGDRVTIYLPMIPEAAFAMLACARIGAVHSVVFGGFSPDSIAGRIQDCALEHRHHRRRGPARRQGIPLKANVDAALTQCPEVETVIVIRRTGAEVPMKPGRDLAYDEARRPRSPPIARPSRWGRRIRCSSSTPPARPASPRACCTPPAAI